MPFIFLKSLIFKIIRQHHFSWTSTPNFTAINNELPKDLYQFENMENIHNNIKNTKRNGIIECKLLFCPTQWFIQHHYFYDFLLRVVVMYHTTISYFRQNNIVWMQIMTGYGNMVKELHSVIQFGHCNTQILAVETVFPWRPWLSSIKKIKFDLFECR